MSGALRHAEWIRKHKREAKAIQDRWYAKHGKEWGAKYREKNHEKILKRQRLRYERIRKEAGPKAPRPPKKEKTSEECRAYQRAWYQKNIEKMRAYGRDWARAHPETVRANGERYRRENRGHLLAQAKEWKRKNPEKVAAIKQARYARKKGAEGRLSAEEWATLLALFDNKCAYCGVPLDNRNRTRDHKIPLVRGGSNRSDNILPACRSCNSRKNTKTHEEFLAYAYPAGTANP